MVLMLYIINRSGLAPPYLNNGLIMGDEIATRGTRSLNSYTVCLPANDVSRKTFIYHGATMWNDIPSNWKAMCDLSVLKSNLISCPMSSKCLFYQSY